MQNSGTIVNASDPVNPQDLVTLNAMNSKPFIQTSTLRSRVLVDDSTGITISGNNSGALQQLMIIRPYSPIDLTRPEIVLKQPRYTYTGTVGSIEHYGPNNTLQYKLISRYLSSSSTSSIVFQDDTNPQVASIMYNFTPALFTLTLSTANTQLQLYDAGPANSLLISNQIAQYGGVIGSSVFTGNQLPSVTFCNNTYFARTTSASQYQIPYFNTSNQLLNSGISVTSNTTGLIIPASSTQGL